MEGDIIKIIAGLMAGTNNSDLILTLSWYGLVKIDRESLPE